MDPTLNVLDAGAGVIPGTTQNVDVSSAAPVAGSFGILGGTGAGQHGVIPAGVTGGNGVTNAVTQVWDWLNQPFTRPLAPMTVFVIVGSITISIILWNMILYHIRIAAESI